MRLKKRRLKKTRLLANDSAIDLWALDEVRFQQHGSRCRMWVPPEIKEPVLLHHPTRRGVGYFGAVRLRDGKCVFRREEEKFNAMTFLSFLKHLRLVSSHSGKRVVVIIDNARYHHAALHKDDRSRSQDKFALEFLPPYCPELNPIERLWKLIRRLATHNQYFQTLTDIVKAVERIFSQWRLGNETVRRLCSIT
jgi:transposase